MRENVHARVLLKADHGEAGPGWPDQRIAQVMEVSISTVARIRKRCVLLGVQEAILPVKVQQVRKRRLDGRGEAYLMP